MQIACATCKTVYNLTADQIRSLPHGILPCRNCSRYIKITSCPTCRVHYSITFSTAPQKQYALTCERCRTRFNVDFPNIRDGVSAGTPPATSSEAPAQPPSHHTHTQARATVRNKKHNIFSRIANGLRRFNTTPKTPHPKPSRTHHAKTAHPPTVSDGITYVPFSLAALFSTCSKAIRLRRLGVAAGGVFTTFILLGAYQWAVQTFLTTNPSSLPDALRSFLGIIPFAIIFIIYIITAAVIARISMSESVNLPAQSKGGTAQFLAASLLPVIAVNLMIFATAELILISLTYIPIVGPLLFSLLFLPIYLISICVMFFIAVGFWFYPPILAHHAKSPLRTFFQFIKTHNFRLAYTIPLLILVAAVSFAAIYAIHYGSFSLSLFISKATLGDEGERIFTAIPTPLLKLSDLVIIGTEGGLFRSLMPDVQITHSIAGIVVGSIVSFISVVLFSIFVSINATLSTYVYGMLDRGEEIDDASKIRLLLVLVLILIGIFFAKKLLA